MKFKFMIFCSLIFLNLTLPAQKRINNIFYAQNTLGSFKNAPLSASEKARVLKSIGYDGLEGFGLSDFIELKKALGEQGLKMPVNYVSLNFGYDGKPQSPTEDEIKSMIRDSESGSLIYFQISSRDFKEKRDQGDKILISILKELSDFAANYNVRLCAYPHFSTYCETVEYSVHLAEFVDRPNYGAALNLCHLLKVEGSKDIERKIKEFTPRLFAVNICGADEGDTKNMDWDRLIQPLGQGTFDTYRFVKLLIDNGYAGPIGLQCYNLKGDAFETLSQSMKTWKGYIRRYADEK